MKFPNPFAKKKPAPAQPTEAKKGDVLDLTRRGVYDTEPEGFEVPVHLSIQRGIKDVAVINESKLTMDSATAVKAVGDSFCGGGGSAGIDTMGGAMSPAIAGWYASQGFIGSQMCAIIAQHWLVGKACATPAEDALRNGWEIDIQDADETTGDGEELIKKIRELDKSMRLDSVMFEAAKFANVFGIRVLIPIVESNDKDYYSKPFNIDGITAGCFRGWNQVDPQWIYPLLDSVGAGDPNSPTFYEPEYWIAGGVQYHRSHLVILKTEEPADILKPSYLFAGIPLTQRIAERVYAAERTANEAPLLAMSKRTTTLKVDLAKVAMKKTSFIQRLKEWIDYRDNYNVKVIGKDEELGETDTSLADLDEVIMTQFQLVAAIAKVPATKLLGTSPKGFNATGDNETKSYHEFLETIQATWFDRFLERHYMLLSKSYCDGVIIQHNWLPVDSVSAEVEANIRKINAETDGLYIDKGVVSPDEVRTELRLDKESRYSLPEDADAPGLPDEPDLMGGQTPPTAGAEPGTDVGTDGGIESDGGLEAAAVLIASAALAAQKEDDRRNKIHRAVAMLLERLKAPVAKPKSVTATVVGVEGLDPSVKPTAGEEPGSK